MPWLKFKHKFAHGKGSWEWRDLGDDVRTDRDLAQDVQDLLAELSETYEYSDKYRGIDYEIADVPPRWVVVNRIEANDRAFRAAEALARRLDELMPHTQDCPTCAGLPVLQMKFEPGVRIQDCPECGRGNVIRTSYDVTPRREPKRASTRARRQR